MVNDMIKTILSTIFTSTNIAGWLKILSYGAVISTVIGTMWAFSNRGVTIAEQRAEIARLEQNIVAQKQLLSLNKEALNQLDRECAAQALRFLREHDIWKRLEESSDPLTDGGNFATEPEPDVVPGVSPVPLLGVPLKPWLEEKKERLKDRYNDVKGKLGYGEKVQSPTKNEPKIEPIKPKVNQSKPRKAMPNKWKTTVKRAPNISTSRGPCTFLESLEDSFADVRRFLDRQILNQ